MKRKQGSQSLYSNKANSGSQRWLLEGALSAASNVASDVALTPLKRQKV